MIRKVKFQDVDFQKYTDCIRRSCQFVFQVEKAYLEVVNGENWDFLVYKDYEAVMPVPFVRKMGFKVVLPPMGIQQLGIFSQRDELQLNNAFYDFLLKHYRVYTYPFNADNQLERNLEYRKNYILKPRPYQEVKMNYSIHRRRNVRLHDKRNKGLVFSQSKADIQVFKPFFLKNLMGYNDVPEKFFSVLEKMYDKGFLRIYQIKKEEELLSVAMVTASEREDYFLVFINNKEVKTNASSVMIDQILQQTIEQRKFSFWGSSIPSIADFYERFGAELTSYPVIPLSKKRIFKI
ncbi:MAG: hypothetical protein CSA38_02410 [Flavobacteriales bacterium]|nr:MAG: hypothetical protein CSA38_02410 [Flavobacteriales bacterium]